MTFEKIKDFINDKEVDWRRGRLLLWLEINEVAAFADVLSQEFLMSEGFKMTMLEDRVIYIDLGELLTYFSIDPEDVFPHGTRPNFVERTYYPSETELQ